MSVVYCILLMYACLYLVTWLYMMRLISESCERVESETQREIRQRKFAGESHDFDKLSKITLLFVREFRAETLKRSIIHHMWICFLVLICTFVEDSEFEKEFREEFEDASLDAVLSYLESESLPELISFRDIILSVKSNLTANRK